MFYFKGCTKGTYLIDAGKPFKKTVRVIGNWSEDLGVGTTIFSFRDLTLVA